jgi:hypothetical protein
MMANMYVANATKHNYIFLYRASGRGTPTAQEIPIGTQIKVSGDLTPDDIEGIILQHERYGFMEVNRFNSPLFGGIIYCVGTPIPEAKLKKAILKYQEILDEKGKVIRKEGAIAVSNVIEKEIIGEDNNAMKLTNLEMSVEEDPPKEGSREGHPDLFSEGIQVLRVPPTEGSNVRGLRSR